MKFSIENNRKFWDDYSRKETDNPIGAHSDHHIVQLENRFILNILKNNEPEFSLDIGCGNGQRTLLFSEHVKKKILGIDYSNEMIKEANILLKKQDNYVKEKISFQLSDVNNFEEDSYDTIISCRCFINQPSFQYQIKLFEKMHDKLNPGGSLIIAEQSQEGINRLDKIREKFGLDKISVRWFNLPINESAVFSKIESMFEIKVISRLGIFYYISRVINPALNYPEQPNPNSKINEIGYRSQVEIEQMYDKKIFEDFGVQLLVHFIKK